MQNYKMAIDLKSIGDNAKSYKKILELQSVLIRLSQEESQLLIDFQEVGFLSANILAFFGCILDYYKKDVKISVSHLSPGILEIMRKNGFSDHFRLEKIPDDNNTTLPYQIFSASSEGIEEFEKYITINLFGRKNIPDIPLNNAHDITDNLLEIFNNVIDHASSKYVYVCGQYFPKKGNLCLSMCDIGNTVWDNVMNYSKKHNKKITGNTLEWAMQEGHSTKEDDPGGLGLSMLREYLDKTSGQLTVISAHEYYELKKGRECYSEFENSLNGMFISVIFNMDFYKGKHDFIKEEIIF